MQPGEQLAGRYRLDVPLGQGGFGEVWRAFDVELGRAVAVKVLLAFDASEQQLGRFRREAAIGARLQHPGITVVHDIGRHDDRLFLVMELLDGQDLAHRLAASPGEGLALAEALDLALQTAEALAAAHARKVAHRDLKPGNLFLLGDGRLKICDFGIARTADTTGGLTTTGKVFGTPHYMAPEQWRGEQADGRCDVYALGCVLYALLTGAPPFSGTDHAWVLMRMHLEEEPPPLGSVRADVPPALVELAASLLAKEPAGRPDAPAVAERLRAVLRGTAVPARVPDVPTLDLRPPAARPGRRGVLFGGLALLAGAGGGTYALLRLTGGGGDAGGPGTGGVRLTRSLTGHTGPVEAVAFSPDNRILASGGSDRSLRLWDALSWRGTDPFPGFEKPVACLAFSNDGTTLVAGSDRLLHLYDVGGLAEAGVLTGHTAPVRAVAFSVDGTTLASAGEDGTIRLWDLVDRLRPAVTLAGHTRPVTSVVFSPDAKTIASGGEDGTIRLWNLPSRKATATLTGHTQPVASVAFSPDGGLLASGSADGTIRLWDVVTRTSTSAGTLSGHNSAVRSVAFSPDGRTLAGGGGRTVRLWDVATRAHRATLNGHAAAVGSVGFSPNGTTLVSGSDDATVRVWKLA
ncbi:WD40 repeat domain-containing serine/threonine protein kinase [Streptomyces sp. NPDC012794]|uniref:WD40 repeat domain-containing serine/threonine protein kinase n=1 Tax=Streptomyces sp. NPDC012794 TaxID=3364850 RepID=UPI0036A6531E